MAKTVHRQTARLAYSIERLAKESNISRSMIYEEITAGRLIARKVGRRTVVRRSDALRWLRSLPSLDPTESNGSRSTPSLDPDREQPRTAVEELAGCGKSRHFGKTVMKRARNENSGLIKSVGYEDAKGDELGSERHRPTFSAAC